VERERKYFSFKIGSLNPWIRWKGKERRRKRVKKYGCLDVRNVYENE